MLATKVKDVWEWDGILLLYEPYLGSEVKGTFSYV